MRRSLPMNPSRSMLALAAAASLVAGGIAFAQAPRPVKLAYAPKPIKLTPYTAPNRPVWRLAAILAAHRGATRWSHDVLRDPDYTVKYVMMAPGDRMRPQFWADDRVFWTVLSGRMRVSIEGQQPFEAGKGFLVNIPYRNSYSIEAIGAEPVLRVEVTRTGRTPLYPFVQGEPVPAARGQRYVGVSYNVLPGTYAGPNKPFVDFQKDWAGSPANPTGSVTWVEDDGSSSFIIRGRGIPTPPASNRGHFHVDYGESWLILEGQIDYLIEGEKLFRAEFGDFVYAPPGRWHRASFAGTGMDTRMSITPRSAGMHNYAIDAGARQ
jgi:mannose-6-phosphate isomerase-like protein (cupin superfamily)